MEVEYENIYHSIVDKNIVIKYNPMKVKHQKNLIVTAENIINKTEGPEYFIDQMKEMIYSLIDINKEYLYYSDFENLMFLIRAKSYGDIINYKKKINGEYVPLIFNLAEDVTTKGVIGKNIERVKLSSGDEIELTPLTAEEYFSISKDQNLTFQNFEMLVKSIKKRIVGNEVLEINNKETFLEDMNIKDFEKLKNAYGTFPRISTKKIEIVNGEEFEIDFGDMRSHFFEVS